MQIRMPAPPPSLRQIIGAIQVSGGKPRVFAGALNEKNRPFP